MSFAFGLLQGIIEYRIVIILCSRFYLVLWVVKLQVSHQCRKTLALPMTSSRLGEQKTSNIFGPGDVSFFGLPFGKVQSSKTLHTAEAPCAWKNIACRVFDSRLLFLQHGDMVRGNYIFIICQTLVCLCLCLILLCIFVYCSTADDVQTNPWGGSCQRFRS